MPNPVGRPPFEITPKVIKKVESLATQGLSKREVALCLGMGKSTYAEKQKEFPEFSDAYDKGAADGVRKVANAMFNKAVEGDVGAQKHYLNNRGDGWAERQSKEISGPGGGPVELSLFEFVPVDAQD